MTNLTQPVPRTFIPGETEVGSFMNAFRDALTALLNPPHFKGNIAGGTALSGSTNLAFSAIEDNYSGWNNSSNYWVVPSSWSGLYTVKFQIKQSTSVAIGAKVMKTGSAVIFSPNAAATGASGTGIVDEYRFSAGDQIAVQLTAGATTQNDSPAENTWLALRWVSA
jgi:hypothetical protein